MILINFFFHLGTDYWKKPEVGWKFPKKIPARKTCLKKILQAVIPKNNKSYALEKFLQTSEIFKKIRAPKFFPPPTSPPPLISNGPSLINVHHAIISLSTESKNWFLHLNETFFSCLPRTKKKVPWCIGPSIKAGVFRYSLSKESYPQVQVWRLS